MSKKTYLTLIAALLLLTAAMTVARLSADARSTHVTAATAQLTTEGVAGKVEVALDDGTVVTHPQEDDVERCFVDIALPTGLSGVQLDVAELVFTISTDYDASEPLLITAAPVTVANASTRLGSMNDWADAENDFDAEYLSFTPVSTSENSYEVRLEITEIVRRWVAEGAVNYGIVLKSVAENKSTFHWIRDGRYDGGDAKLVILYPRL